MLTWSCNSKGATELRDFTSPDSLRQCHLNSIGNLKSTSSLVAQRSNVTLAIFDYSVGLCEKDTVLEPIIRTHCPLVTITSIIFKSRCRIKNAKILREAISQLQNLYPRYNLLFVVHNPLLSALLKHFGAEKVAWSSGYLVSCQVPKRVPRLAVSI